MPTAAAQAASLPATGAGRTLAVAAMAVFMVTPRASPGVVVLLIFALGGLAGLFIGLKQGFRLQLAAKLVVALGLWGLLSVGWAADQKEAVGKSILLIVFALAVSRAVVIAQEADPDALKGIARAMLAAFAVAVAYLAFEEVTGHALKRFAFMLLPFAKPGGKVISDPDGEIYLAGYISNRNMAAMVLALWPMLLISSVVPVQKTRLALVAGLAVFGAIALAMSKHETSILALVASLALFGLSRMSPRAGVAVLAAAWVASTLLIVPVVGWASTSAQLYNASWLPNSARHRIVLWAYTAEQVWTRPIAGVGAASTKLIDARRGPKVETLPGTSYEWRSGPHAHNVYLQTWYELGVVGAGLLCAAGLALIAAIGRLPRVSQPFVVAGMTAAVTLAGFSWGMWQAWFLGLFAMATLLAAVAVDVERGSARGAP